jgi:hypothetical protein
MVPCRWQEWGCFEDIRETLQEKGWTYVFAEHNDAGRMPLLAESAECCISFFERDPGIGECWFELRDRVVRRVVFVRGAQNIPTPERAKVLLEHHGVPSYEVIAPHRRPLYSLPVVPVLAERPDDQMAGIA